MHYGYQICSWKGYRATANGHYSAPMKLLVLLIAGAKTLKISMINMKERLAVFACYFKSVLPGMMLLFGRFSRQISSIISVSQNISFFSNLIHQNRRYIVVFGLSWMESHAIQEIITHA
jgi:hypothetical protein